MRRPGRAGLGVLGVAVASIARGDSPPPLTAKVIDALTLSDTLASSNDFETAFGGSATAVIGSLAAIALDPAADVGVQLRAIRGLAQFPTSGPAPHDALVTVIATNTGAHGGAAVLILRAGIEALGALAAAGHAGSGDEALLAPHLNDESRDIRATAARAIGEVCDPAGLAPLHARNALPAETSDQVKIALRDAIRALTDCP